MYGKAKHKGREIAACCTRPNYAEGYIMVPIFPVLLCKNCGEVTGPLLPNRLLVWIFEVFFAPFWTGGVHVIRCQISDEEIKRVEDF